jgi:deoxyribodipyrimidine photo-lyase
LAGAIFSNFDKSATLRRRNFPTYFFMTNTVLFWHRRDLRLVDNVGLQAAAQSGANVVGIFCLDPAQFDPSQIAPAQVDYVLTSLQLLQAAYLDAGSRLLIMWQSAWPGLVELATGLGATALYCNESVEPSYRQLDRQMEAALQATGIELKRFWDHVLHGPAIIYSGSGQPYTVYTPYWRNWQGRAKDLPVKTAVLPPLELSAAAQAVIDRLTVPLPTLAELGFTWDRSQILAPGTAAAMQRLELFTAQAINSYDTDRNFPAIDGTSTLSPALAWGTIGIRTVWQATTKAWEQATNNEARQGITTWQQEIAWREFYHQALYHFPQLLAGSYRPLWNNFPWTDDRERFAAWCQGKTGYPIVDAAMRQLNQTGWMHNRCRMIVASFLTKDLMINWQWGEQYFMQTLVDGEPAANNGGWQWSASSGMDPKPLRIFNPYTQAQKFDNQGMYIRHWLPELKSIDTKDLLTGNIPPLWRASSGYPEPIVDHSIQQREFKRLYQLLKT